MPIYSNTQKNEETCQICGGNLQDETGYLEKFNHSLFNNRSILICPKCGFGQISPKIEKDKLNDYYEDIYRSKDSIMYIDFDHLSLNMNFLDYRSLSQLLLGAQYLRPKAEYRFLDIGAGLGHSFVSAKKIFGQVKLFAIETNNAAVNFYKRCLKDISCYRQLREIKEKMDVVLMSHSLEHFDITEMGDLFRDIRDLLADEGIVIIEVPHVDLRNSAMRTERFNDTPHLSFFSLESMRQLVDGLGFETCFLNTVGQLNAVSFSREINMKREQMFKTYKSRSSPGIKTIVKDFIKKSIQYVGFYDHFFKIYSAVRWGNNFYENINFKYGGERDALRCVLRKK